MNRDEAIQVIGGLEDSDLVMQAFVILLDEMVCDQYANMMQPVMDPYERAYAAGRSAGLTDYLAEINGIRQEAGAIARN